jgi:hypothetical protein
MSDELEPVAKAPEEGNAIDVAAESNLEESSSANATSVATKWPWAIVAGIALIAGVGGFAIGNANHPRGLEIDNIGNHQQFDPNMGGQMGGKNHQGPMGQGRHMDGQMAPNGQMPGGPMGPHCEDTSGVHAPVNADGSCPTGFTLDDKSQGGDLVSPSPTASGATS